MTWMWEVDVVPSKVERLASAETLDRLCPRLYVNEGIGNYR